MRAEKSCSDVHNEDCDTNTPNDFQILTLTFQEAHNGSRLLGTYLIYLPSLERHPRKAKNLAVGSAQEGSVGFLVVEECGENPTCKLYCSSMGVSLDRTKGGCKCRPVGVLLKVSGDCTIVRLASS